MRDLLPDLPLASLLSMQFLGNRLSLWGLVAIEILVLSAFLVYLKRASAAGFHELPPFDWRRLLPVLAQGTSRFFLISAALVVGLSQLGMTAKLRVILWKVTIAICAVQMGIWIRRSAVFALQRHIDQQGPERKLMRSASNLLNLLFTGVIWSVVLLLVLQNLGVNVTALIAGLGVGGVAIALGVQNILGDLFASLSIVLDRPFDVGDVISVGDITGTVERIGLKTTRLRNVSDEELIISNSDILKSRIKNQRSLRTRRCSFLATIAYGIGSEQLQGVPDILRDLVDGTAPARFESCLLKEYGDIGIVFEIVYVLPTLDPRLQMDVQQRIFLALYREFQKAGIFFAQRALPGGGARAGGAGV